MLSVEVKGFQDEQEWRRTGRRRQHRCADTGTRGHSEGRRRHVDKGGRASQRQQVGGGGGSLRHQRGVEGAESGVTGRRGQWRGPFAAAATRRAREALDAARRQGLVAAMACVVRNGC